MGMFNDFSKGQLLVLGVFFVFIICLAISMCYKNKLLNTLENFYTSPKSTLYLLRMTWCSQCE